MKTTFQKFILSAIGVALLALTSMAQHNPVKWNGSAKKINSNEYVVDISASIEGGWYVYSQNLESDLGPVPTSLEFEDGDIEVIGDASEKGNRKEGMDKAFGMNVIKYLDNVTFSQKIKVPSGKDVVECIVSFMTCNGEMCLPPKDVSVSVVLN